MKTYTHAYMQEVEDELQRNCLDPADRIKFRKRELIGQYFLLALLIAMPFAGLALLLSAYYGQPMAGHSAGGTIIFGAVLLLAGSGINLMTVIDIQDMRQANALDRQQLQCQSA